MKVLNLQCNHAHGFEGWFGSEDDFQDQLARGLVECPLCGDTGISKLPSAPRLNLGASESAAPAAAPHGKQEVMSSPNPELQAAWMQLVKQVMTHTEDVGENFAEEARKIHYGESEERGIRGQASKEETQALLEEGINVLPLPIPKGMKGPLQ
ncbi:MAG: DUF1178 family protein [Burkholderiales bacterium]